MQRLMTTTVVLAMTLGVIGCGSTDGGSNASNSNRPTRSSSTGGGSGDTQPFLDTEAAAVYNRIRDARVLLYQPQNGTQLIMVNHGHSKRRTRAGQLELCNNRAEVGYMPQSDRQIDALLESMRERNAELIKEPWTARHDRLLKARKGQVARFKGMIMVENDGRRYAYVGWQPQGNADVSGQERYRVFTELKFLVASWSNGYVERPGAINLGLTDPASINGRR